MSYALEEWVQLEAASYADYLRNMSGIELVEEYYRQGGEDVIYIDQRSKRLVVNGDSGDGCPKCHSLLVGHTDVSGGGCLSSCCWCPACGYLYSESLDPNGSGGGGEEQLSQAELLRFKAVREKRILQDGVHWRGIPRRREEVERGD